MTWVDQLTLIIKKGCISFSKRTYTRIWTHFNCRKVYNINFTVSGKKFCLSLHYNGANTYLLINGVEQFKFKAKDSSIVANPLYLENISKDWGATNMKKTRLFGYVHDFSVDYGVANFLDIVNTHKYLMLKNNVK